MSDFFTYKNIIFNKNPKIFKYLHILIEEKRYIDQVFYIHDKDSQSIYDLISSTFQESSIYNEFKVNITSTLMDEPKKIKENFNFILEQIKNASYSSKKMIILDINSYLKDYLNLFIDVMKEKDIIVFFHKLDILELPRNILEEYHGLSLEFALNDFFVLAKNLENKTVHINCLGG